MEVDVRQEGRYRGALRGTSIAWSPFPVLHYPGLKPFLDESQNSSVTDTVFEELHHPVVVYGVEVAFDVRIKDP